MLNRTLTLSLLSLCILAGCAQNTAKTLAAVIDGQCEYLSSTELRIQGSINGMTLACVKAGIPASVETLRVDTPGGNVRAAIEIARSFSTRLHIIVEGECNSSCANYFIPLADRLTFMPNAIVVLHGSADQGLVDKSRETLAEKAFAAVIETHARQAAFVIDYSIHPGWLKTRDKRDYENSSLGKHLEGTVDVDRKLFGTIVMEYMVVYEPLLRSCFPDLEIEGIEQAGFQTFKKDTPLRKSLLKKNFVGSGTLRCI